MSDELRKAVRVPRGVQYLAGRAVHVTVGGAGCQGLASSALGCEDEVVELDLPVGRRGPDDERAADLTTVSAVDGAETNREEVSFFHTPICGPMPRRPEWGPVATAVAKAGPSAP